MAVKGCGIHVPLIVIMKGENRNKTMEIRELRTPKRYCARCPTRKIFIAVRSGLAINVIPNSANGVKNMGKPGMKREKY
ncbi:hypothetical protein N9980_00045 [bacterium]|nr:hypothetical protein [bacterium]